MANFLENQPLQLAPYRGLPTELYGNTGAYKQDQYDQGVQRVQGAIDSVSGIDVSRDIDKDYLNQRVNEITSTINNSGKDWGNKSLVGQAQSLALNIAKDKNIQAAAYTTAKIKQATGDLEAAKKEGKSSAYTEYNLAKQIDAYQKMGLGATANISYTPYSDTHKKIMDIIGKITKSSNESDNAYTMNSEGKMVLSDAIARGKFAGVSPKQVEAAIYAGLDGNDIKQLSMEGEYNYSNQNADQLKATITKAHQSDINELAAKRKIISDKIDGLTDVGEKSKLGEQLNQLDEQIKSVTTDNQDYMDRIDKGDLDGVRGNFNITKVLRGFGNAFSYSEVSQTYQNNPMTQIAMQRAQMKQEFEISNAKLQQENMHFMMSYSQKERFHTDEEKDKKGDLGMGRINYSIDQKDLPEVNIQNFQEKTNALTSDLANYDKDYLTKSGKDQAWLDEQRKAYDKNPSTVPGSIKDFFDKRVMMEKDVYGNQQLITNLTKEADEKVGTLDRIIPKDAKSVRFGANNKTYNVSPEELVNFNDKLDQLVSRVSTGGSTMGGGNVETLFDDNKAKQILSEKELVMYNTYKKMNTSGRASLNPTEREVVNTLDDTRKINQANRDLIVKRNNFINTELAKRTGESQRASFDLPAGKTEQRAALRSTVSALIARAKDAGQGMGTGVDEDKVAKLNGEDETSYHIITKGKTAYSEPKYWIQVNGKNGKSQTIPISIQDKRDLMGTKFEDGVQEQFSPITDRIRKTTNGTTNFNGTYDAVSAAANPYLHSTDFTSVKNFSVKGDIFNQNGKYGLVLYIVDPYRGNKLQRVEYKYDGGLMDEAQINAIIPTLTDNHIYQLLNGNDKDFSADKLKELQEINKKAF